MTDTREAGRKGGLSRSEAKIAASRANAAKGAAARRAAAAAKKARRHEKAEP